MKIVLWITFVLPIVSCNNDTSKQSAPSEPESNLTTYSSPEIIKDSTFMDFFERFIWDYEFQKSRIVFPIKLGDSTVSTSANWHHIFFNNGNDFIPILSSKSSKIYKKEETVKIELSFIKFEQNIVEIFRFKQINDQWFLQESKIGSIGNQPDFEFIEFLTEFSNDSVFQINHIRFPITESYADSENDYEIGENTIAIEDWEHLRLVDILDQLMIFSNMEMDSNFRRISLRGIENGIAVMYTFEKIEGEWKLTKLEDYST